MKAMPAAALLLLLGLPALAADPTRPDLSATPGALNPQVTQANNHETICRRGWTRTIRPPRDYTTTLKRQQLAGGPYAAWHARLRDYEEDHLVPLSLGGAPWDTRNLWPEPLDDAERKDDQPSRLRPPHDAGGGAAGLSGAALVAALLVVNAQMEKAGVRLAAVLNAALR